MKTSLDNLDQAMNDIKALITLSNTEIGQAQKVVIYRSAIVLIVASWEQFIEQLAERSVLVLTQRLRNSDALPEDVKQGVSLFSVPESRSNKSEFSKGVWGFSDKGWKDIYIQYCKNVITKLNTASPYYVRELYKNILGIRDITMAWELEGSQNSDSTLKLNNLVDIRHDIAHGTNKISTGISEKSIMDYVEFISSIAQETYSEVFIGTAKLYNSRALRYSLSQSCYKEIIELGANKNNGILSLNEIKSIGSSAQGNHNKLCYEPWSLLEKNGRYERKVTDQLLKFYNGELSLPYEILVFENGESIAAPKTDYVTFSDL